MIVLLIATLFVWALGYFVVRRWSSSLRDSRPIEPVQVRSYRGVLLYGLPEGTAKLQRQGIPCQVLHNCDAPLDGVYAAVLALSANDEDNLTLCYAARETDPCITLIARCSDPALRDTYQALGVCKLLSAAESADSLLRTLQEVIQ